jgi:hypothetical protein
MSAMRDDQIVEARAHAEHHLGRCLHVDRSMREEQMKSRGRIGRNSSGLIERLCEDVIALADEVVALRSQIARHAPDSPCQGETKSAGFSASGGG